MQWGFSFSILLDSGARCSRATGGRSPVWSATDIWSPQLGGAFALWRAADIWSSEFGRASALPCAQHDRCAQHRSGRD